MQPTNPYSTIKIPKTDQMLADYYQTLERLYGLARGVCREISQFDPELILVLAHGGWGALWATQALWAEIGERRLPPALAVNLGREKLERYENIRSSVPCVQISHFAADYAGDVEVGYFLAWLGRQTDWLEALRGQIMAALDGRPPERILVLDDTTWEGGTYYLALGLLSEVFPACSVRFWAGELLEWRPALAWYWLSQHPLDLPEEQLKKLQSLVCDVLPGTEDVDAKNSFEWRQFGPDDPTIREMALHLPVEVCLAAPAWAEDVIRQAVVEHHRQGQAHGSEAEFRLSTPRLRTEKRLFKHLWLEGKTTRRRTAAVLGITPAEAGKLLDRQVRNNDLLRTGRGGGVSYALTPAALTRYDQRPRPPLLDAYWVDQGRLMAGDVVNVWNSQRALEQVEWLRSQEIRCVITLTDVNGYRPEKRYQELFEEYTRASGVEIAYAGLPLRDYRTPTRKQVQAVLNAIASALAAGQPVYLQGIGDGMPETIAGCYLVEHGLDGAEALQALVRLRAQTAEPWRLAPALPGMRRRVRRWGNPA